MSHRGAFGTAASEVTLKNDAILVDLSVLFRSNLSTGDRGVKPTVEPVVHAEEQRKPDFCCWEEYYIQVLQLFPVH